MLYSISWQKLLHQVTATCKNAVLVSLKLFNGLTPEDKVGSQHSEVMTAFRDHVVSNGLGLDLGEWTGVDDPNSGAFVNIEFSENDIVDQVPVHLFIY